jgi:hypothetical protein
MLQILASVTAGASASTVKVLYSFHVSAWQFKLLPKQLAGMCVFPYEEMGYIYTYTRCEYNQMRMCE